LCAVGDVAAVASMPDCECELCGDVFCATLDCSRCWATFETCVTGDVVICDDDVTARVSAAVTDANADGESLESMLFDDVVGFCAAGEVTVDVVFEPAAAVLGRFIFAVGDTAFAVADVALPAETVVSFCCDGLETATTDDVIGCGGDVTD